MIKPSELGVKGSWKEGNLANIWGEASEEDLTAEVLLERLFEALNAFTED